MKRMTLWLDGTDPETIKSDYWGDVIGWKDKSGNDAHFQQHRKGATPKTGLRTFNGHNVISFDGMRSFIHGMKNIQIGTVLIVASVDNGYDILSGLFCEALKDENNIRIGEDCEFSGNSNTNLRDFTNAGGEMFINGAVSQKVETQIPFLLTAFPAEPRFFTPLLSQSVRDDRFWKGDIGEVKIWGQRLDAVEQEYEEKYLMDKWKI